MNHTYNNKLKFRILNYIFQYYQTCQNKVLSSDPLLT